AETRSAFGSAMTEFNDIQDEILHDIVTSMVINSNEDNNNNEEDEEDEEILNDYLPFFDNDKKYQKSQQLLNTELYEKNNKSTIYNNVNKHNKNISLETKTIVIEEIVDNTKNNLNNNSEHNNNTHNKVTSVTEIVNF